MPEDNLQTLLTRVENREIVLPEFQREFTWRKEQSRDLIDSLLKDYPVGSLLIWRTKHPPYLKNMPDFVPDGRIDILLDGQQRLTALYMLTRNAIPPYYSERDIEDAKDPRQLYFNLETADLRYYKKIEMENNPRWVRLTDCFVPGRVDLEEITKQLVDESGDRFGLFTDLMGNYNRLLGILQKKPPVMQVQDDADLLHALTVFDRVNSNGTPLTDADVALAYMCSAWADARRVFKAKLAELSGHGFAFDLTFLIRAMNAVINGRAEYRVLHSNTEDDLRAGWHSLDPLLDYLVNFLRDRAFIYSTDDINTSNVLIPVIGYLAQTGMKFQSEGERRKILYWIYAALFQTRYSGTVDTKLERDLAALDDPSPIDNLIAALREDQGDPTVTPSNLDSRGVVHPLYNMTVIMIRANGGVDWSNGLAMGKPIGKKYSIERHHIFPASFLANSGYDTGKNLIHKKRVHEIANRVPLTKAANMDIFYSAPHEYLPIVENANPGNLSRFMIPMDAELWRVEAYEEFLQERRRLIADRINEFMRGLLEGAKETDAAADRPATIELIRGGESDRVEFKSSLRWNFHAERKDPQIEHASLKTIAAFMNSDGGTLLIGVDPTGSVIGLEADGFPNADRLMLHLSNLIKDRIGTAFLRFVRLSIDAVDGRQVLRVDCQLAVRPAYLKHENDVHLYIRTGPGTDKVPVDAIHDYIEQRFRTGATTAHRSG